MPRRAKNERGDEQDGADEGEDDPRVGPAPVRALDDPGGEQADAQRELQRADPIGTSPEVRLPNLVQRAPRDECGRQADRHVDEEDPAPAELEQDPADPRTERRGDTPDGRPDPHRDGPLLGGKAGRISPSVVGSIIDPPAACSTRAATRKGTAGAAAQSAEARENSNRPDMKIRLRPIRSAIRPAGTSSAAKTIAYPFSTQERLENEAPSKSRAIDGRARLTMNRSRLAMNSPTEVIRRIFQRFSMVPSASVACNLQVT